MLANVSACLVGSQLGHPEYMGVHTVLGVCVGAGNALAHMFIKRACSGRAADLFLPFSGCAHGLGRVVYSGALPCDLPSGRAYVDASSDSACRTSKLCGMHSHMS